MMTFNESTAEFAALRDALLPKLISGELRLKDSERFLEDRGYDIH
jgi:type I restriction enzyme S subunit